MGMASNLVGVLISHCAQNPVALQRYLNARTGMAQGQGFGMSKTPWDYLKREERFFSVQGCSLSAL